MPSAQGVTQRRRSGWTPLPLMIFGVGTAALTAAAILFAFQLSGRFDRIVFSTPETGTAFNAAAMLDTVGEFPERVGEGTVMRLTIPEIGVDAPVIERGIDEHGVMEVPDNGRDVVWYDFSAVPGGGGNAVFSGHVDFRDVGRAVFWHLGDLEEGDIVEAHLEDGRVFRYQVTGKAAFDADTAPVEQIIGHTSTESVTLITCTGTFDRATRQYDQRLVVRAELIGDA